MPADDKKTPKTGPGSTDDPNQADRTGLPDHTDEDAAVRPDDSDPKDAKSGPGSTRDPNQANRT